MSYGDFALPLRDSMLDRAFECWVHADDIASAVDYPYEPPSASHLRHMIDLTARMLPEALAAFRSSDLARRAFGDEFCDQYIAFREWEAEKHRRAVTDWERRRYFGMV